MPPRPSPLRRELTKEQAARQQAEQELAEERRRHQLEEAAERAHHSHRQREIRAQLRLARAEAAEAQQQAATAAGKLEGARVDHQAQLAELEETHRNQVANLEYDHGQVLAELRAAHAAEVERLAQGTAAKRAAAAEAAARQARQELQEVRQRLEGELAGLRQSKVARERQLRGQVTQARRELAEEQRHATGQQVELDQTRATVAELEQRLAPREPEPAVAVRWIRDSPPEGAVINGRVYRGRGPRTEDRRVQSGFHSVSVEEPGEVMHLPQGAAHALYQAGYVVTLGDAAWVGMWAPGKTAGQLLGDAMELTHQAERLGDLDRGERAQVAQLRDRIREQVSR